MLNSTEDSQDAVLDAWARAIKTCFKWKTCIQRKTMKIVTPAWEGEMSQAKNRSEKDPKVLVDVQFSMKLALAKSHLFLGYITVRTGLAG